MGNLLKVQNYSILTLDHGGWWRQHAERYRGTIGDKGRTAVARWTLPKAETWQIRSDTASISIRYNRWFPTLHGQDVCGSAT